jgi:hypothetical protein
MIALIEQAYPTARRRGPPTDATGQYAAHSLHAELVQFFRGKWKLPFMELTAPAAFIELLHYVINKFHNNLERKME